MDDVFQNQLRHLSILAQQPGFKAHAWHRAKELEADPSGLWQGLAQALTLAVTGPAKDSASDPLSATKPPCPGPKCATPMD